MLIACVLGALIMLNCFAVEGFGETEYWLSLMKIIAIFFFIITTIYVLCRDNVGLSAWDKAGGPFLGQTPGDSIRAIISEYFKLTIR